MIKVWDVLLLQHLQVHVLQVVKLMKKSCKNQNLPLLDWSNSALYSKINYLWWLLSTLASRGKCFFMESARHYLDFWKYFSTSVLFAGLPGYAHQLLHNQVVFPVFSWSCEYVFLSVAVFNCDLGQTVFTALPDSVIADSLYIKPQDMGYLHTWRREDSHCYVLHNSETAQK